MRRSEALRTSLSAALLLPGYPHRSLAAAQSTLFEGRLQPDVYYTLAKLQTLGHESALPVLAQIADYLDSGSGQIDYQRRRSLAFDDLLGDSAWTDIWRRTETPPTQHLRRLARLHLYQRITGNDLRTHLSLPRWASPPGLRKWAPCPSSSLPNSLTRSLSTRLTSSTTTASTSP